MSPTCRNQAGIHYAYNLYPDVQGVSNIFGGGMKFCPEDEWTIGLSHRREHIIDNATTFNSGLYRDNYAVRSTYSPHRRVKAGADYMHSYYSDDNNRNAYGVDVGYYLMYEPRSLLTTYRYEEYLFDRSRASYFSPDSFHYHRIGIEWREYLNTEELYWGANDTFYSIRYAVDFDPKDEVGHWLCVDLHHDFSDKHSAHLEWSKTIYEHGDTYRDNRATLYMRFYF